MRFLTDYLSGDTYFKIAYPEHNLDRTTFYLVERHEQLQGLIERVKYLLNSYINELNRYLHRHTWGLTP